LDQAFTAERIQLFSFRTIEQFHLVGIILLALVLIYILISNYKIKNSIFLQALVFFGGLFQFLLYFTDKISQEYTGYPRLYLMAWVFLLSPIFLLSKKLSNFYMGAALTIVFIVQGTVLFDFISVLQRPSYSQSFTEYYGIPYYFPIRELTQKAEAAGLLQPGQNIIIISPSQSVHFNVFPFAYHDLALKYSWKFAGAENQQLACQCRPGLATLVPTPQKINLNFSFPYAPYESNINLIQSSCLTQIEQTCGKCVESLGLDNQSFGKLCVRL
jgi:hypothetical protein